MALTYRSVKGSALTIDELDDNFRHFTGSHPIEGDLTIMLQHLQILINQLVLMVV